MAPDTRNEIADIERRIVTVESVLIVLSIAAIAAADHFVATSASLGFLYLIPMSYSALAHRRLAFALLLVACVGLRVWDTPVETQSWGRLAVDWTLVAVFVAVVVPLRRLGRARVLFFRAARRQRDELVREVEMAARVQQHLLDQHRPPAGPLDVVARTHPARVVGGDYYDFVPLDGDRFAVVVADVAGKGLPAALIMPAVKIALRTLAQRGGPVDELLGDLNRIFLDNLPPASYFTLVCGVFDAAARRLVYANAGHPPALHLKARGGEEAWLTSEGPAVGLLHEAVRFETVDVPFERGDVFVFYSDGITEAEDASGADFGRERLAAVVRGAAGQPAAEIVSAVHGAADAFRGAAPRGDDATVIVVRAALDDAAPEGLR
jgi:sigma-B regulation protein RsbU (phosphoserine phosphatase)